MIFLIYKNENKCIQKEGEKICGRSAVPLTAGMMPMHLAAKRAIYTELAIMQNGGADQEEEQEVEEEAEAEEDEDWE